MSWGLGDGPKKQSITLENREIVHISPTIGLNTQLDKCQVLYSWIAVKAEYKNLGRTSTLLVFHIRCNISIGSDQAWTAKNLH
jgi:hypothetical protein